MSRRLLLLCPGQGGQHAGMFAILDQAARVAEAIQHWPLRESLGMPLEAALHDASFLYANRTAQPLIVAATLAAWEAVRAVVPVPSLVAGYSIGELASYAVAGSLSPQDAITLAALRARLMDECVLAGAPHALLAVSGIRLQTIEQSLSASGMHIAIETGEDSAIVGGYGNQAEVMRRQVEQLSGRVTPLPVTVASHTPLMGAAAAPFLVGMRKTPFANPAIPVVSGITADEVHDSPTAVDTLARQLVERIRWRQCMDTCAEAGMTIALELGPGNALSRMLTQRHPHIACRAISDFRSVAGLAKWVDRHFSG